ncbi:Apolipoprotein N-acyltransferase [Alphaproteobacteria bacterium SO-S41]|nr:Apolipoprotein N-acyltransferase [Alphaproteobacteria bacterium SO-S41]
MNQLARMGLAALAGGAAVFGMAPFNLWPVLLLALGVFAWLIDDAVGTARPIRRAAWTGWAFGFAYFAGGFYWIGEAFYVDPSTIWMMPFAVTLLPAGMALYYALAGGVAAAFGRRGAAGALILTAAFATVEFVRGFLFTGFPWNLFGSAFIDAPIAQGAALIGVYGLTFAAMLAGFSLAPLVTARGPARAVPFAAGLVLLGGLFGYGMTRANPDVTGASVRLRVVQPDNPQSEKAQRDYMRRLWQRLTGLTFGAGADKIDVFIWPEGVIGFLDETPEALTAIGEAMAPGQFLLAGSARRELTDDGGTRYFNALLAIDGEGRVEAVYDKAHLVPFGEYLPFPEAFRMLDIASLTARIGGAFTAGPGLRTLELPGVPAFGALICYEALFPHDVVAVGPRPRWLVNVTDDSWFGTQTGPHQHLTAARFRAIEEGLPVIRAATTGISAVIDAEGTIVSATELQTATALDADLPAAYADTLFARFGHWSLALLILISLVSGLVLPGQRAK